MGKLLTALLLALSLHAVALAQVGSGAGSGARTVSVVGTGTAYGEPDMAIFEAGVNVVSEDVAAANAAANEEMATILEALVGAGVAEHDIRTVGFNIWREERYSPEGQPTTPVFRVVNTVRVTVREVDRVGELLGLSIGAGANSIGSVQYTLEDPAQLENAARERAMRTLRDRAERLAGLAGVSLGEVLSISETPDFYPMPPVPAFDMDESAVRGADVPVAAGQLSVTVTLQVTFGLE